jgi:hypothetical protein
MDPAWIRNSNTDPLSFPSFTFSQHIYIFFTFVKRYKSTLFVICPYSILVLFLQPFWSKVYQNPNTSLFFKNSLYLTTIIFRFITKHSLIIFHFIARSATPHPPFYIPSLLFLKLVFVYLSSSFCLSFIFLFTVCPQRLFQKFKRLAKRFMKRPWPGLHYFVITTPFCTHLHS